MCLCRLYYRTFFRTRCVVSFWQEVDTSKMQQLVLAIIMIQSAEQHLRGRTIKLIVHHRISVHWSIYTEVYDLEHSHCSQLQLFRAQPQGGFRNSQEWKGIMVKSLCMSSSLTANEAEWLTLQGWNFTNWSWKAQSAWFEAEKTVGT